jgi:septal ring factor EnvC (AmiA/AmiB activator)
MGASATAQRISGGRMTTPIHTVKHIRAGYRKYQILALVCVMITIAAALLAALSGLQLTRLRSAQTEALAETSPPAPPEPDPARAALERDLAKTAQALAAAQTQLATERENVKKLMDRVGALERQLAAARATLSSDTGPAAVPPPATPDEAPAPKPGSQ